MRALSNKSPAIENSTTMIMIKAEAQPVKCAIKAFVQSGKDDCAQ